MKTKKWFKYSIAIFLVFVMFVSAMPYSLLKVFADEVKNFAEESKNENVFVSQDKFESTNIDDTKQLDEAYIIDENIENRTVKSKEFAMSDGSILVQYFAQNVHYLDEDKTYKEIDNTLIEAKDEEGDVVYENKSNFYKVRMSKDIEPNKELIEIENEDYALNFTYIESSVKTTLAKKHVSKEAKTANQYNGKKLKGPKDVFSGESKISYNNISEDVDLEYEVKDSGIKENIIVKDYLTDYDFDFKIEAKNLILQKNEDGSISALDSKEEIKYLIPAPFMFDANGEYNYDVEYILNRLGNRYFLTISADEEWIETKAKLPVTIDPIIETWNDTYFSYVNVYEKGSGTQSTSEVYVGEKESGNKSNAYFRFELKSKGYNYALVNAAIRFHHKTEGMGIFNWKNIKYSVSVVDSEMLLSNITYTNKPARLQFLRTLGADTNLGSTEATNTFDIDLNTIKSDVVTIGFEREANNSSGGYVKIFTTGSNGVYLTLRYKQVTGLDDSYSMESSEINGVTAYVNKASGLLTMNCNFASVNNLGDFPLQTSLVYNAFYNDIFTEIGVPIMFGNDFKLNFQQYVREEINEYMTLYDADGSITTLNYDGGYGVYRTADGKLTAGVLGIQTTVFDTQLNKRVFEYGRLKEIYRGEETTTGITYTDRILISYVQSGGLDTDKISNISFYNGGSTIASSKITFSYSDTRVSSVTTYYGTTAMMTYTLSYDDLGNLIKVRNSNAAVDIYNIEYDSYDGYLNSIFNKDNEGFYFSHMPYDDRIWKINQIMGTDLDNSRWFDYIEFDYDTYYSLTETYYYKNGRNVAKSYTSFDVSLNPISEWVEDESGKITGFNRGYHNFQYAQNGYLYDYTRENVYFEEKLNTTFSNYVDLSTGQTASGSVTSSSGIVNNSYYKYGLTFLVESRLDMDLTVTFAGQSKRIVLENGGILYVTLPCGYVQSGTFVFKNNSSIYSTRVSNVTYNVIDYVKETKSFGAEPANYNVYATTEVVSYNKKGEYEQRIYDGYQRLTTVNQRSIQNNVLETTTYTYNSTDLSKINQVKNITAKSNGSTVFSEDYTYSDNDRTVTTITNANGAKKKTVQNTTGNTNGFVVTKTDENNIQTVQTYAILNGNIRLQSVKTGNILEKYTYNYLGDVTSITLVDSANNAILATTNSYNNGIVSGHTFANNTFTKTYDTLGFVSAIKHNGNTMLTYEYVDDKYYSYDDYLKSVSYANGQIETYSYNWDSTTIAYKKNTSDTNSDDYTYNYDSSNRLTSSNYTQNGIDLLNYNYGNLDSTTQSTLNITGELSYDALFTINHNDVYNRIASTSDKFTKNNVDTTYNVTYGYNNKGQIISNSIGAYISNVTYDAFDRLNRYVAKNSSSSVIDKSYVYDSYTADGTTYTTNRLKSITDNLYGKTAQSSYDSKGFVTSIQYNGKTYNYTYDSAGRLASESIDGVTRTYTYNQYNTILSVNTGGNISGYNYDSFGRITSYIDNNNNVANYFRYDAMGNPVMYKGSTSGATNNMVWTQGRKLESGTLNSNTFSYAYDMNGLRYKKTVNSNVTEYYLDGSTIIAENRKTGTTDNLIYYIYDMMGLSGMIYNGETYYYEKNTLGDIIGIRNSAGTQVATYSYDAWGNIISKSGTMADVNPFRYRGYYYDNETGFYYLQTRYYDPSIRMFINADKYELTSTLAQTVGQLNMYAYANNNPIMFTDESGESIVGTILLGAVIGGLFSGGFAVANQVQNYGWDTSKWDLGQIVIATLGGMLSGAVAASPLGLGWQIGVNTGINVLQNVATQTNSGQNFNFVEMIFQGVIGAFSGYIGGRGIGYINDQLGMYMSNYIANKTTRALLISLTSAIFKSSAVNILSTELLYIIGE